MNHFDLVNELVQQEPVRALDPEVLGACASIGMVKGQPFQPDERTQGILTDAAAVGTATARTLGSRPLGKGEQD